MKFYSIKQKKAVDVNTNITHRTTANGRHQLVADYQGEKLYRFVSAADAKKYK